MTADAIIFAGVELSSGRKPATLAGLDEDLKVRILESLDISAVPACLQTYEPVSLAVSVPTSRRGQDLYTTLRGELAQAGYQSFSQKHSARQWLETDPQDCFRLIGGHTLFPRRSLEGRLQRTAILYEQGLQLTDPIDMFEEITRYKLIQGILPLDELPSSKRLDALVAAYLAWLSVNRSGQIVLNGQFALPAEE